MNDVEIYLISNTTSTDENGFEDTKDNLIPIWANERSIRASEFYEADKRGIRLSRMFIIKPYEYNNEQYIMYNNDKYKVERTYQKNTEELEVVCSGS